MTDQRLRILIDGLVDGWLDEAGQAELFDELRGSPASCEAYWRIMECHQTMLAFADLERADILRDELDWTEQLKALAQQESDASINLTDLTERVLDADRAEAELTRNLATPQRGPDTPYSFAGITISRGPRTSGLRSWHLAAAAVAAVLLLASTVLLTVRLSHPPANTAQPRTAQTPNAPHQAPAIVGRITATLDARWLNEPTPPTEGGHARARRYTLVSGYAELTFDDGAVVTLQGPCTYEPTGRNALRLSSGQIAARADGPVKGFVVQTPSSVIRDLGTAFVVAVDEDGLTEAYTLEGLIRVQPTDATADDTSAIDLAEGQAAQMSINESAPRRLAPGQSQLAVSNPARNAALHRVGVHSVQGDIQLRTDIAPATLLERAVFADHIMLIPEATGLVSTVDLRLDASHHTVDQSAGGPLIIPAGVAFDSYLLLFKPHDKRASVADRTNLRTAAGRIRFNRPPLGVIYDSATLQAFYQAIGPDRLDVPSDLGNFALELSNVGPDRLGTDVVRLAPDIYSIDLRLDAIAPDVIRVLVPHAPAQPDAD